MDDELQPILIFFTKATSGPARRMESLLAQVARKERGWLRVRRVDVDQRPEVAGKLGVGDVPSLVLVVGRKVAGRIDGRANLPQIERLLDLHLSPETVAA